MTKNVYLGKCTNGAYCILKSSYSWTQLLENQNEIEAQDFQHDATNWSGCDDLERTLQIRKLKLTGVHISLKEPISFEGTDYDHGHEYGWGVTVHEIYEVQTTISTHDTIEKVKECLEKVQRDYEKLETFLLFMKQNIYKIENLINELKVVPSRAEGEWRASTVHYCGADMRGESK